MAKTVRKNFPVTGMGCAACVARVQGTIKNLNGVSECNVSLASNSAQVDYDPGTITAADIKKAVQDRYSLRKIYLYLKKDGSITCGYQNFYQLCKKYIFKNSDLKNVRSDDLILSNESTSNGNQSSQKIKGSLGLPKNSFDNWDGDSRDFMKDLL